MSRQIPIQSQLKSSRGLMSFLLVSALVAGAVLPHGGNPASADDLSGDGVAPEVGLDWGDTLPAGEVLEPPCDEPPCEPTEIFSAGSGGYIPITPARLMSRRSLRPGVVDIQVAGSAGVPEEDVGAVVVNVAVSNVVGKSAVTLWRAGGQRPSVANIAVDASREWTTLALVELGAGGEVSLHNKSGRVDVDLDVLGWFPAGEELFLVGPQPVLSTVKDGPPGGLRADGTVDVAVTGVADVPTHGVAAVVLDVRSANSTASSGITVWPTGQDRLDHASLVTEQTRARGNLAIVAPGEDGMVSVHNETGRTHLSVQLLGWLPDDSAYRPVPAGELLDTSVASGETIDVEVAGRAGVPGPEDMTDLGLAHAVVVNLTAPDSVAGTAVALSPAGAEPPEHISLAGGGNARGGGPSQQSGATVTLAVVALGDDDSFSVTNLGAATDLQVHVVGWFAVPDFAGELAVPASTQILDDALIESAGTDGSIDVAPGAEPLEVGQHVVVGVTDDTPDGYLGAVTSVSTGPDGSQRVETTQALLDDVFPEGEITGEMGAEDYTFDALTVSGPDGDGRVTATATATSKTGKLELGFSYEPSPSPGHPCVFQGLSVFAGVDVSVTYGLKWRLFKAPLVTTIVHMDPRAQATIDRLALACSFESPSVDVWKAVVFVGPVPVTFSLGFAGVLDLEAGIRAIGTEYGAKAWAELSVGIKDNALHRSGSGPFYEYTNPFDLESLVPRDLSAYAMVDVWLKFSFAVYGQDGPWVKAGPFLEAWLTTEHTRPWWGVEAGLAAEIGANTIPLFNGGNVTWFAAEIPPWYAAWLDPCDDVGGPAGVSFDPGPCLTTAPETRANGKPRAFLTSLGGRVRVAGATEAATLKIEPIELPDGTVGEPYPEHPPLQAEGWRSWDVEWKVVHGQLPPGMELVTVKDGLQPAAGIFQGTPTRRGSYHVTVAAWWGPLEPGPVEPGATPPFGPTPAPQIGLDITVHDDAACSVTVTDAGDTGEDGQLRHALAEANDDDTVCLRTDGESIRLTEGELVVPAGRTLTLNGEPDGDVAVDGNNASRVLRIEPDATVTLLGVGIRGGSAEYGGGVWVAQGAHLHLVDRTGIFNNHATTAGGGVALSASSSAGDPPSLTIDNSSSIFANGAIREGGGVYSSYGDVTLDGVIAGNLSQDAGGGVHLTGGTLTVNDAGRIQHNRATNTGGGIQTHSGTVVTLNDHARVHDNHANQQVGGGIFMGMGDPSTVTLNNYARITGNHAKLQGGGIFRAGGYDDPIGTVTINDEGAVTGNTPDDFHPPL